MNDFEKLVAAYDVPTTHPAFAGMEAAYEAVRGPWAVGSCVETDLHFHDHRRLHGDDVPAVFGWCLSTCNTLILDPRMDRKSLKGYLGHIEDWKRDTINQHRYFFWNGQKLAELTSNEAFCRRMGEAQERSFTPADHVSAHNAY